VGRRATEKRRGIKRVPRKIEDFSGCFKGVRLINNLVLISPFMLHLAFEEG